MYLNMYFDDHTNGKWYSRVTLCKSRWSTWISKCPKTHRFLTLWHGIMDRLRRTYLYCVTFLNVITLCLERRQMRTRMCRHSHPNKENILPAGQNKPVGNFWINIERHSSSTTTPACSCSCGYLSNCVIPELNRTCQCSTYSQPKLSLPNQSWWGRANCRFHGLTMPRCAKNTHYFHHFLSMPVDIYFSVYQTGFWRCK